MAKSKKKAGAAQIPSTTRQQGRKRPKSDIAAQQLSKETREETLKPEEEEEGNDKEMNNVEEETPNVKMASPLKADKQEEEGNDKEMNNVEEETPNVKMASPLKADKQQALERNGQSLCGRNVVLNIARKHGPGLDEQAQNCTAFVRGFGKKQEEDEIKNILTKHFGICGGIVEVRIPKDEKLKCLKGFAYIQFVDRGAVMNALELNGSELDSCTLVVEKAKPVMHGRSGGRRSGKRKRNPNVP